MMNEEILFLYSFAVFILTLSPGPDILFLVSTTLNKNLNNAIVTAFGLCSGILIHTLGTAFGLGYFVSKFPELLSLIKLIGCIYLVYLSYLYFPKKKYKTIINKNFHVLSKPYTQGLIMNLTNPKIILFFIGFFPQFIFHDQWTIEFQFYILGLLFSLISLTTFICLLMLISILKNKLNIETQSKNLSYISSFTMTCLAVFFLYKEIEILMN